MMQWEWDMAKGRLIPYWITVLSCLFIVSFWCAFSNDPFYKLFYKAIFHPLTKHMHNYDQVDEWSDVFIGIIAPVAFASCACSLLLTTHRLPTWRCSWLQRIAAALRRHPSTREKNNDITMINTPTSMTQQFKANFWFFVSSLRLPFRSMSSDALYGYELASKKVNQFGRGEPDFNMLSFACIFLPITIGLLAYMPVSIALADGKAVMFEMSVAKLRFEAISYLYGYGSIVCLSFFLIPVTRHSVLLAAMGWSPIHALRIHIWFGYMSFVFMFIHGILLVPVWFFYDPYPVYRQFIPDSRCWTLTWTQNTENDIQPSCSHVYANLSGLVAANFYLALWGSSLNWVRRRNYRLFYILHVSLGTLALLGITLHMYCVKTKTIVLHWVVREPGLCRYYVDKYVKRILKRARTLNLESTLAIYVYLTGSEKALGDLPVIAAALEPSISIRGPSVTNELIEPREKVGTGNKESPGHPLELPRMLPRRFAEYRWNIPYFIFYTVVTVIGFGYLFDRTPKNVMNYYELSEMTWTFLYAVFMYGGFSVIAETCVLCLRNFWPQPVPDVFEVVATGKKLTELSDSDDVDATIIESGNPPNEDETIVYRQGRPTSDQIFKDARSAAEPGIFMCGPSALTQMVKAEASKENSYLGLTRYCLYDEPYEM
ncbi:hypothetical protein FisN_41Lu012 [Fistulifera solaris]|uniref:Ferric oxidoreductase domain-containing protein n=1 Tax=Fistulifera solaris TaxID=1519565 RepID=A0A1Z5KPW8_FISSO|nr:hypothetical protein FisN_41Lu012 [Fistulifera solaris]|eukprot:GAX28217.1 hypothetical protein FisN_41Lu012 [Fistulifera solaris]